MFLFDCQGQIILNIIWPPEKVRPWTRYLWSGTWRLKTYTHRRVSQNSDWRRQPWCCLLWPWPTFWASSLSCHWPFTDLFIPGSGNTYHTGVKWCIRCSSDRISLTRVLTRSSTRSLTHFSGESVKRCVVREEGWSLRHCHETSICEACWTMVQPQHTTSHIDNCTKLSSLKKIVETCFLFLTNSFTD